MKSCWKKARILWIGWLCLGVWAPILGNDESQFFFRFSGLDVELEETTERFDTLIARHVSPEAIENSFADTTDSGFKIADAVKVHRYIALELGVAYFGQYSMHLLTQETQYDVISKMFALQGGIETRLPLGMTTFYAKLSANYWREETEIRGPDPNPDEGDDGEGGGDGEGDGTKLKQLGPYITLESVGENGVDAAWEVGLEVRLAFNLALYVGYEETSIHSVELKAVSAGFTYRY